MVIFAGTIKNPVIMFCKYCGQKIDDDSKFCQHCGKPVNGEAPLVQDDGKIKVELSLEKKKEKKEKKNYNRIIAHELQQCRKMFLWGLLAGCIFFFIAGSVMALTNSEVGIGYIFCGSCLFPLFFVVGRYGYIGIQKANKWYEENTKEENEEQKEREEEETEESQRRYKIQNGENKNGVDNAHEYVDLGLSVKWATCNVGASSPDDYGNYYAWGETETKSDYSSSNNVTYGEEMGSISGDPNHDVVRLNWGGTWRLPTKEEMDELIEKCTWKWTRIKGHNGYKVIGPNGNSIFLPAGGWRNGRSHNRAGEYGSYWSATPDEDSTDYAYYLSFYSGGFYGNCYNRYYGQSVRPVTE